MNQPQQQKFKTFEEFINSLQGDDQRFKHILLELNECGYSNFNENLRRLRLNTGRDNELDFIIDSYI